LDFGYGLGLDKNAEPGGFGALIPGAGS